MLDTLPGLAAWFTATWWRLRFAAFLAGALSILSMAPYFLWPILWLTLPALLWLIDIAAHRADPAWRFAPWQRSAIGRAAETGWWFGFGYHVFGLFWIGEAFLVEAEVFAWLLPFAVTGLPAGLALFTAAACAFTIWAAPAKDQFALSSSSAQRQPTPMSAAIVPSPLVGEGHIGGDSKCVLMPPPPHVTWSRVVGFAIGLGVTEWLRGHILTGFPWNVLGYALTSDLNLHLASVFGIYALTVIAVLLFCAPALVWRQSPRAALTRVVGTLLASVTLFVIVGLARDTLIYMPNKGPAKLSPDPTIRIVQPSVPQREKWRPENQRRVFDDHLALSDLNTRATAHETYDHNLLLRPVSLIVWPEAAMPFLPLNEPVALAEIGRALPDGVTLASGALRADPPATPGERRRVYNSLILFGRGEPSAEIKATYDKTHLVPFGEYLPAQRLLEAIGLQQLSRMRGGFASGPEPRPLLDIPGIGKVAPLICYEAIFPGRVVQTKERPRAFLNVTNDGWFGNTTGPRQHLHMARVRAVEEGIPVIRAANNGISAVIDAQGTITARLDLNVRGSLDARLPPTIPPPLYARWGDTIFWCLIVLFSGMSILLKRAQ